jgi:hypothetical protein
MTFYATVFTKKRLFNTLSPICDEKPSLFDEKSPYALSLIN